MTIPEEERAQRSESYFKKPHSLNELLDWYDSKAAANKK